MKESRLFREAREEGQVEARRAAIIDLLRARFGETTVAQQEDVVNTVEDIGLLRRLVVLAGTCATTDEFRAGLPVHPVTSR